MRRALLLVLAVAACDRSRGPHVTLRAPNPDASFEDRRQAFEGLKADGGMRVEKAFVLSSAPDREYLQLVDGTKVWAVEDLMPVVRESTETGQALKKLQRARTKQAIGMAALVVGGLLGGGLMMGGIVMIARSDDPNPVGPHSKPGGIAITIIGSAILGGGAGYGLYALVGGSSDAVKARKRAFERYTDSLANSLRICTKGIELVDCATGQ